MRGAIYNASTTEAPMFEISIIILLPIVCVLICVLIVALVAAP